MIYPKICKLCRSPARKLSKLIFCSNYRCSSRRRISREYKASDKPIENENIEHYVICPKCFIAADTSWSGINIFSPRREFGCINHHHWSYTLKDGDMLKTMSGVKWRWSAEPNDSGFGWQNLGKI